MVVCKLACVNFKVCNQKLLFFFHLLNFFNSNCTYPTCISEEYSGGQWSKENSCIFQYYIREYGSTLYVGMARKTNGWPYISIASDELKSLVIYTDKFEYTHTCSYLVFL